MLIRQYFKEENGQRTAYWALVESYRAKRGLRQRVVAWLGKLDEAGRLGVKQAIDSTDTATGLQDKSTRGHGRQQLLFEVDENTTKPRWGEVNVAGVRGEKTRQFGGPWLALHLIRMLQLDTFFQKAIPEGREQVPWDVSSLILIIARLLKPSSELYIAEQW